MDTLHDYPSGKMESHDVDSSYSHGWLQEKVSHAEQRTSRLHKPSRLWDWFSLMLWKNPGNLVHQLLSRGAADATTHKVGKRGGYSGSSSVDWEKQFFFESSQVWAELGFQCSSNPPCTTDQFTFLPFKEMGEIWAIGEDVGKLFNPVHTKPATRKSSYVVF